MLSHLKRFDMKCNWMFSLSISHVELCLKITMWQLHITADHFRFVSLLRGNFQSRF